MHRRLSPFIRALSVLRRKAAEAASQKITKTMKNNPWSSKMDCDTFMRAFPPLDAAGACSSVGLFHTYLDV